MQAICTMTRAAKNAPPLRVKQCETKVICANESGSTAGEGGGGKRGWQIEMRPKQEQPKYFPRK